ncbi:MAG: hypothetical protein LBD96_02485 [Treponema sp.]|jgi:alpha-mannosidase|nr:hypothetical protein [Treponema sp.]
MLTLAGKLNQIRTRVGGNYEKHDYPWGFVLPGDIHNGITMPGPEIRRILGELGFALTLNTGEAEIREALELLEKCLDAQGVLTREACAGAEQRLLPLRQAAREYRIIFAAHAHIDMNWMWSWQETVGITLSTFRTMLTLMDEYPDFTFSQSQASVYDIVEQYDPDMMEEIKRRIREGRWEVTASSWVETDKNMPCTESLLRHILYTKQYFETKWGIDPASLAIDFSPDTFGQSARIPEIDNYGGVKYLYHCRGLTERQVLYRYRSPSGQELLAYCEPFWYNGEVHPDLAQGAVELASACGGLKTLLFVYGVGDHGGGPTRRDIELIKEMQQWPVYPELHFGTFSEFFRAAETVQDKVPIVDREINFVATGCYTTQSRIKLGNRHSEAALLDAESLDAMGRLVTGKRYPHEKFVKAWQGVLFTHFHDIITGSCKQDSREYAMAHYSNAFALAQTVREKTALAIAALIDTSAIAADNSPGSRSEGGGAGFGFENFANPPNPERGRGKTRIYHVFNPGPQKRRGPVELTVWDWPGDIRRAELADCHGKLLPFQLLDKEPAGYWGHRYFRLIGELEVPAFGYTTVIFREAEMGARYPFYDSSASDFPRAGTPHGPVILENNLIRAEFDPATGNLSSLVDKETGVQQLAPGETAGLILNWAEKATNNAWETGRYLAREKVTNTVRMKPLTGNILRNGLEIEQKILNSTIKTEITLDRDARSLACKFSVTWNESADAYDKVPVLCWSLPLGAKPDAFCSDIPAGTTERQGQCQDIPGLSFTAALFGTRSLALVTDCKYGYRADEGNLGVTLINSSCSPDPFPERGEHVIHLWVSAGQGGPRQLIENAENLLRPLTIVSGKNHTGTLPLSQELIGIDAETSVVSSLGLTDDGALLLRFYETSGIKDTVGLSFFTEIKSAEFADPGGQGLKNGGVKTEGRKLSFEIAPYAIRGVRINI